MAKSHSRSGTDAEQPADDELNTAPRSAGEARRLDAKVEAHLRGLTQAELADIVCALARRFPEVAAEYRGRLSLASGDATRLLAEARKAVRAATKEPGWGHHWDDDGFTPDYARVVQRFERLLAIGRADDVVPLGREFIQRAFAQVDQSDDEGETATAVQEALPVVFRAVAASSLSGAERLLFAIDAVLLDDRDVVGDAADGVLAAEYAAADWSQVADTLAARLEPGGRRSDDFTRNYERDKLTTWIGRALERAGRGDELATLYENEVRATGSYERYVGLLIERGDLDAAEQWAGEGIATTAEKLPGIAAHLAKNLCEIAAARMQWDVAAAFIAQPFFERPHASGFATLLTAARKAGVEAAVRAAALRFLETGTMPYRVVRPAATAAPAKGKKPVPPTTTAVRHGPAPKPGAGPRVEIDPAWPLPVPAALLHFLEPRWPHQGPHLDVLLDMAIADERPDEVLRWFDAMAAAPRTAGHRGGLAATAERVAAAVAHTHPQRALDVFRTALNEQLPHASPSAYEKAVGYLRKMRPLYEALSRGPEWTALVASIRETCHRRRLLLRLLDQLDGQSIVQAARKPGR